LIEEVLKTAKFVKVTNKLNVIKDHDSDNKFLECALAAKANFIVSGDKHLLKIEAYKKIKILRVIDFLQLINMAEF